MQQNAAKWLGLTSASTDLLTERKAFINDAYRDVVSAFDWPSRYGSDVIQTTASEATSTLQAASVGATALTINDAVWLTAWTGRKIRIGDETYTVTSFDTTATATIADGLTVALAGGEGYTVYQDEFSLPSDCAQLLEITPGVGTYGPLRRISFDEMAQAKSFWETPANYPTCYTEVGTDSSGYYEIQIYPTPASIINLTARYDREVTELSADADIPTLLPTHVHHLIEKRTKVSCYEHDNRMELVKDARRDYETAVAFETQRARKHKSRVRLDPDTFRGGW